MGFRISMIQSFYSRKKNVSQSTYKKKIGQQTVGFDIGIIKLQTLGALNLAAFCYI